MFAEKDAGSESFPVSVVPIKPMEYYRDNLDVYYLDKAYRLGNERGSKVSIRVGTTYQKAVDKVIASSDRDQKHLLEFGTLVINYRDVMGFVDKSVTNAIMADKDIANRFQAGVADGLADKFALKNIDPRTGKRRDKK